jgi:DNA processing protein
MPQEPLDPLSDSSFGELGAALARRGLALDAIPHWEGILRSRALRALDESRRAGIEAVARADTRYPIQLAAIPDPPPVLCAIVGSRAATPHALEVAHRLGQGLAGAGVTVVSGLARGVDSAAHRGALSGDGRTIAVLGSGVDVIYPPEHAGLAEDICRQGTVLSELAPHTAPDGWHFPRRNRIISGLSLAVVVVEASELSGSLITATCGLEQGRAVMAVPGGVLSGRNKGAHGLIKDGARVVEGVDDVLQELHLDGSVPIAQDRASGAASRDPIARSMLAGEVYDLEQLMDKTGLGVVALLARLAELEMRGLVERSGCSWVRSGRTNVLR